MNNTRKIAVFAAVLGSALAMGGCSDSGNGSSQGDGTLDLGLPDGQTLSLLNSANGAYHAYNTESLLLIDLNATAQTSQDSAVQKLEITDTSTIGSFFHWPDFRVDDDGDELLDMKYLLMKPSYQPGSTIDSDQFVQLVHFHDEDLAAHSADEFANPAEGSGYDLALQRLNAFVAEQAELEEEVGEAMEGEGQTLCRAYVDPYIKFEMEHKEGEEGEEEEEGHEHGDLFHFGLSDTGRVYFFEEGEAGLEQVQGFVVLDNVTQIADCSRTTIARVSEEGVLVFVPDTQMLYLVDAHGGDFHQHSVWSVAEFDGLTADLVAILGEGGEHDHDHE